MDESKNDKKNLNENKSKKEPLIAGYESYCEALLNFIKKPNSKFTIGVYGEWGTGKTTLMRTIYEKLNDDNKSTSIIPVWFNAWQYEAEPNLALLPLLGEMAEALKPEANEQKKMNLKKAFFNVCKSPRKELSIYFDHVLPWIE